MGLLPGEEVEVLGVAPLGDPMAIRVGGTRLALRRRDAARVALIAAQPAVSTRASLSSAAATT
jgi:Fe2+ transport system protein FeoA